MTGNEEFGEVFLTDVRVPRIRTQVLGEVGGGWNVAMLLLSFERGSSAIGQYTTLPRRVDEAIADIARKTAAERRTRRCASGSARRRSSSSRRCGCTRCTSSPRSSRASELGFESSMTKLQWSETHQDSASFTRTSSGTRAGDPGPPHLRELDPLQPSSFLWSRSETIWGGSSQVQRNIVAERVLGLPR